MSDSWKAQAVSEADPEIYPSKREFNDSVRGALFVDIESTFVGRSGVVSRWNFKSMQVKEDKFKTPSECCRSIIIYSFPVLH